MLYHILFEFLYPLNPYWSPLRVLNVFRYLTFRTAFASLTALVLSLALGPWLVARQHDRAVGVVVGVLAYVYACFYTSLDILAGIASATTKGELQAVGLAAKKLNDADAAQAREAWAEKAREIKDGAK